MFTRHAEAVQEEADRQQLNLRKLEEEDAIKALRKAHSQELAMSVHQGQWERGVYILHRHGDDSDYVCLNVYKV